MLWNEKFYGFLVLNGENYIQVVVYKSGWIDDRSILLGTNNRPFLAGVGQGLF